MNQDVCARWTRNRATNQQKIFVRIDFHDAKVLRGLLFVAHVTGEMLPLPHARRKRAGADAARSTVEHRTVASLAAAKVPALHAALKTFALADARHVDVFADLKTVDEDTIARFGFVLRILDANFTEIAHRRNAGLFEMAGKSLIDALRLDELHKAELNGVVA